VAQVAYQMKFKPIVLKQLILDCGLTQLEVARDGLRAGESVLNLIINRNYAPTTIKDYKKRIEGYLSKNEKALEWLADQGLQMKDLWQTLNSRAKIHPPLIPSPQGRGTIFDPLSPGGRGRYDSQPRQGRGGDLRQARHSLVGRKVAATRAVKPFVPGDPTLITISWEVEMISQEAMKHFKIFRNPFVDDIQKDNDIYMSEEHRYIEAAMLDCARHGGFLAVIGEVGSGKSVMRRKVVEQLRRDGDILVIYPQMIDKTRLTAASICDAIIMDISDERPNLKLEQKTRQVQRLLLSRSKNGYRSCLIIEEAHDLNTHTLKYLKRFYELEDGYRKLLGIILIGQTELKHMFNESLHVDMREVIRRCQIAEIQGLNGHIQDYLSLKFKRVGAAMETIFHNGSIEALAKRLTSKDRQSKTISHAYPLLVNNYAARAMNLAFEMGEALVTAEVVDAL
jgi:type II secretory pathway predicted ATPase ExeA